jgi:hypothetical protein
MIIAEYAQPLIQWSTNTPGVQSGCLGVDEAHCWCAAEGSGGWTQSQLPIGRFPVWHNPSAAATPAAPAPPPTAVDSKAPSSSSSSSSSSRERGLRAWTVRIDRDEGHGLGIGVCHPYDPSDADADGDASCPSYHYCVTTTAASRWKSSVQTWIGFPHGSPWDAATRKGGGVPGGLYHFTADLDTGSLTVRPVLPITALGAKMHAMGNGQKEKVWTILEPGPQPNGSVIGDLHVWTFLHQGGGCTLLLGHASE